jgi:hypothetical protein
MRNLMLSFPCSPAAGVAGKGFATGFAGTVLTVVKGFDTDAGAGYGAGLPSLAASRQAACTCASRSAIVRTCW